MLENDPAEIGLRCFMTRFCLTFGVQFWEYVLPAGMGKRPMPMSWRRRDKTGTELVFVAATNPRC